MGLKRVKILGEELGGIGRWYIAIPPLLLIGFLISLFFLAAAGQARLEAATERVRNSQLRQQYLSEYLSLITGAESGQRGYLLTGDRAYLAPYYDARQHLGTALDRLHGAYGVDGAQADRSGDLRTLTGKKMSELADTVALFDKGGFGSSLELVRTDSGKKAMDDILGIVGAMRAQEAADLEAAASLERSDLTWSRLFTITGAVLNIGLVLLAMRLVYGDMRRRTLQASQLRDQKAELERQVDERTLELSTLSTLLQEVSEQEKAALSRELHDELGGLLVAARMDLSWLQQRLPTDNPAIEQRFKRIHESLSAGVELKRRVVEELRPTLLDNMGLFAALRWQFKETCRRTGLSCSESIPEMEPPFSPDAAIGIFRIAQEALTNILKHARARTADLSVTMQDDTLVLRIADDGAGIPANRLHTLSTHGLASMRHRITALGGTWNVQSTAGVGTVVTALFPLSRLLAEETAAG
jgi:signal transduction histidine kinase